LHDASQVSHLQRFTFSHNPSEHYETQVVFSRCLFGTHDLHEPGFDPEHVAQVKSQGKHLFFAASPYFPLGQVKPQTFPSKNLPVEQLKQSYADPLSQVAHDESQALHYLAKNDSYFPPGHDLRHLVPSKYLNNGHDEH